MLSNSVPKIHAICPTPQRLSPAGRLTGLIIAGCCLALLITASFLPPNQAGYGSHTKLGLAQCSLMERANLPCPSCGMTTSFSWFVRGNWLASFYVQPMGMLIALGAAMCVWAGIYAAVSGKPLQRLLRPIPSRYYVIVPFTLFVLGWIWKIFIHLRGIDGWG